MELNNKIVAILLTLGFFVNSNDAFAYVKKISITEKNELEKILKEMPDKPSTIKERCNCIMV
jgi:hypothetical protein